MLVRDLHFGKLLEGHRALQALAGGSSEQAQWPIGRQILCIEDSAEQKAAQDNNAGAYARNDGGLLLTHDHGVFPRLNLSNLLCSSQLQ